MSIFSNCTSYAGSWEVKSVGAIPEEDKKAIQSAHVVNSQYGLSVCFMMKAGNRFYIPVDEQNSTCEEGDAVDLDKAKIVMLGKQGEADIQRVRV